MTTNQARSAVLVAARRPGLVAGLVLIGPFVRDPKTSAVQQRPDLATPAVVHFVDTVNSRA